MRAFLTLVLLSGGLAVASAACDASKLDASSGTGGSPGTGGGGGTSGAPGSVTFVLATPPGVSFCDQLSCSGGPTHLSITGPDGQLVNTSTGLCGRMDCATCQQLECPLFCHAPEGVVYTGGTSTWDGSYLASSTCGTEYAACSQPRFAAPGRYVAQLCATPGDVTQPDGSVLPVCTATGPTDCVQVMFDFPSSTPVYLNLRGPAEGL